MVSAASATDPETSDDDDLSDRGQSEDQQADLHRANAGLAGLQRAVDAVHGVMGVRREDLLDRTPQSVRVVMVVLNGSGCSRDIFVAHPRPSFDDQGVASRR